MPLKFKSFIRCKLIFLILFSFIPFIFGMIIYTPYNVTAHAVISLVPDDQETISLGKSIYIQHCSSCHGIKLEGQKIGCLDYQMD